MAARSDWRLYFPEPIRALPADLAVVLATVVLTLIAALTPGLNQTPLRDIIGLPFVLFVPGYTLIAALFPECGPTSNEPDGDYSGIDGIERVALSFGASIAVSPLIGLVLNFTPWGLRLVPILTAVGGFTVVTLVFASVRRNALPEDERFAVPYETWIDAAKGELFDPDSSTDAVLNVVLVVSLLLATTSVGYVVAVPNDGGESFSELYLLTEDGDELVADNYPETLVQGEPTSLVLGIGNQEHRPVNYTTVVLLQRVEVENNSTTVLEEERLKTFSPQLEHNETWHQEHQIQPTMTGERLRLTYLLYKEAPPESPTIENAYQEVHLWVTVRPE
ncbi:DUF1616 domain-containing protein [Haloferax mediterranei ATCC 33500]|uniref:DUF1616 domain-containing protein n=1 Tax=Haloferax mediterranei (strain ATCC 33500 / DSM 1411 / JCM 8866 / NBRC 14739 / NCIMB 2177 / R-4) TaxID=523841 RepID=I3R6R0_HALMT|nr:DUF1616 domain-containing protein [Haloferax mediterranei]AFK19920.2 hypothetical protein HFX_2232 [Haloferax mediterranei ATCC 33500]AHZ23299.1 membrane protein [Haloferax mediterranei ATCC 33500]ELZ99465.1 hypothetical protein C439_12964 [Haloferax mediterranei ATCC 33500]MDX5987330.1 DUF1616 domain-containing protein [Haloferax mediterranei ATCC 33500]QCQ73845.1 DUF1616 domain-containing protein [Haloferax mediterranei ATCC 33500]